MKIGKEIRPYKGVITRSGKGTMFSCQDSKKDDSGQWIKSPFYTVYADNVSCHIDEKNPEGIKIIVKKVDSVSVEKYTTKDGKEGVKTTIGSSDVEVVQGTKKTETQEGFSMITDEEIPF